MINKKILFLVKSEKTPSSRIRICDLMPFLEEKGIESEIEFIPKSFFARRKLFKKCAEFDLTVFQKRLFSRFEFRELRRNAKKLAFDFDDAVFLRNAAPSLNESDYISPTRRRRFRRVLRRVDFAVAANMYLADEAIRVASGTPVEIIPSSVDISDVQQKVDYKLSSSPVIGWIGSSVTQRYLDYIAPELCELRREKDFVLNVISDIEVSIPGLKINNIPWSLKNEICEIPKFDIGIMPLSSDPFSKGKASYKLLQYMAAGVPSVASSVGMNIDVAGKDEFAMLANSQEEFSATISLLIDNDQLRESLGKRAKWKIENEFSRKVIGERFAELMKSWVVE